MPRYQFCDTISQIGVPDRRGELRACGGQLFPPFRWREGDTCHKSVSAAQFRRYKRTSTLDTGVLLVCWLNYGGGRQLIAETEVEVVERGFLLGDLVARPNTTMTGVVLTVLQSCRLRAISEVMQPDGTTLLCLTQDMKRKSKNSSQEDYRACIPNVPGSELKLNWGHHYDQVVTYHGWVGRVIDYKKAISLRLTNNSVVEVEHIASKGGKIEEARQKVGEFVETTKATLRNGRWIYGSYNPNVAPRAAVVHTRTTALTVDWRRSISGGSTDMPPEILERIELESSDFAEYDHTKLPPGYAPFEEPGRVSRPHEEIFEPCGVHFVDQASAFAKYGSYPHKLTKHERADHLGYDMNVFDVVDTVSKVDVLWQNGSISQHKSPDVLAYELHNDEQCMLPGSIAHSVEAEKVLGEEDLTRPKRVGIIQSVDAFQCTAKIRWCPNGFIQLISVQEVAGGDFTQEVFKYHIGIASGEVEDVSLYDIEAPAGLNVGRGDMVIIDDSKLCGLQDIKGITRLGQIVNIRLDGALTIRLGAAQPVKDIVLLRSQVTVVITAHNNREVFEHDAEVSEDDSSDSDLMDVDGDEELYYEEREPTYEDENGQTMHIDDVMDDDWESVEEDTDGSSALPNELQNAAVKGAHRVPTGNEQNNVDMDEHDDISAPENDNTRTKDQHTEHDMPPESKSSHHYDLRLQLHRRCQPTKATEIQPAASETLEVPPAYTLHDSVVPADHHYYTSPASTYSSRMKQIQKEHQIFQKQGAIPEGVYVHSWESRPDLWRVLLIGPQDTPYADAPFIVDFYLPTDYPQSPPEAFFHSWTGESALAGVGKVNPNLYEDGKICLSLLGTWEGDRHENWNPKNSTLLQVVVSLLGLVLVREPYFNEAGYEEQVGTEEAKRPSILYTERVVLRSLNFAISATAALQTGKLLTGMQALEDVLRWLYLDNTHGAGLLAKLRRRVQMVLDGSAAADTAFDGLNSMSQGACISLRRVLVRLDQLMSNL